jgi:hypothetical protein
MRGATMKLPLPSSCIFLFLVGWLSPAQAQSFGPPLLGEVIYQLQDREGNVRFTLGAYAAQWQNTLRATVTIQFANTTPMQRTFRGGSTTFGPLLEGTYSLSRHWSIGFWYTRISNDRLTRVIPIDGQLPRLVDVEREGDLADLHVVYQWPQGTSAQVGFFYDRSTIHFRSPSQPDRRVTLRSWNVWLTQRLDVRARCWLITPFISAGYHPGPDLEDAKSIFTGIALTFDERISLSGSVWWLGITRPDPLKRVTVGLVYRY